MALDIIGSIFVRLHIITLALTILWFGLGKQKSWGQFRAGFNARMLGIKKRSPELHMIHAVAMSVPGADLG